MIHFTHSYDTLHTLKKIRVTRHSLKFSAAPNSTDYQLDRTPDPFLCPSLVFRRPKTSSGHCCPAATPQPQVGLETTPRARLGGVGSQSYSRCNWGSAQAPSSPTAHVPPGGQREARPPPQTRHAEWSEGHGPGHTGGADPRLPSSNMAQ